MDHQLSFADSEFSSKRHQTRKEKFLGRMEKLIPWPPLVAVIEPHYPKAGNGPRPYPLATMLSIHCMHIWTFPYCKKLIDPEPGHCSHISGLTFAAHVLPRP